MSDNMDWEQAGTVAVRVGNFPSRDEFESYLQKDIDEDLDIEKPINQFAADIGLGFTTMTDKKPNDSTIFSQ